MKKKTQKSNRARTPVNYAYKNPVMEVYQYNPLIYNTYYAITSKSLFDNVFEKKKHQTLQSC